MRISRWKIAVLRIVFGLLYRGLAAAGRLPGARYPRFLTLAMRAKRAADQGRYEQAAVLARELLDLADQYQHDWNYGNALHHAHLVLGRVALAAKDLACARSELLLAGQTPGSPQLDSFGPNMRLARDLLRVGQRDVVLEYLALCRRFWEMGPSNLTLGLPTSLKSANHNLVRTWRTDAIGAASPTNYGIQLAALRVAADTGRSPDAT